MVGEIGFCDCFAYTPVLDLVRFLQYATQPVLGKVRLGQAGEDTLDVRSAQVIKQNCRNPAIHRGIQLVIRPS